MNNKDLEVIELENKTMIFANAHRSFESLASHYSDLEFKKLVQVHGNRVVQAQSPPVEADGHWQDQVNQALCIATADCLPVLFAAKGSNLVAAAHAGWRGVVRYVVPQTINVFLQEFIKPDQIHVYIGPHIQQQSFEVKEDVAEKLRGVYARYGGQNEKSVFLEAELGSYHVSLSKIVEAQVLAAGIPLSNLWYSDLNTYSCEDFYSYRRQPGVKGRNFSFVYMKDKE